MTVTREFLEAHLDKVRARVEDPRAGLFGPSSMLWRINRERLLFLAGGRASLLQEAHPYVAHGVDQHSLSRTDPIGRFKRTFKNVHAMLFGDLESALRSARRVHAMHTQIRGQIGENSGAYAQGAPYEANDSRALMWVHATLWESSVVTYELLFRPLSRDEKERYYQETKLFAYLFGISDDVLPPTWPDFIAYNERMWQSNELAVERTALDMKDFIFTPPTATPTPSAERTMAWYRVMTAGLLPQRFREEYELPFGAKERAIYDGSLRAMRATGRYLPRKYRFVPAYFHARKRIGQPIVPTIAERLVVRKRRPKQAEGERRAA